MMNGTYVGGRGCESGVGHLRGTRRSRSRGGPARPPGWAHYPARHAEEKENPAAGPAGLIPCLGVGAGAVRGLARGASAGATTVLRVAQHLDDVQLRLALVGQGLLVTGGQAASGHRLEQLLRLGELLVGGHIAADRDRTVLELSELGAGRDGLAAPLTGLRR